MTDINPNSRTAFVDSQGRLSKYGMDVIGKLYRALQFTGTTSAVDNIGSIAYAPQKFLSNNYIYEAVSSDYQVPTAMIVEALSPLTITLIASPSDGDQVVIYHNADGDISVTDGSAVDVLTRQGTVISYRYIVDSGGWVRGA